MHPDLAYRLQQHPVLSLRESPELRAQLQWAVHSGQLVALLPGVFVTPDAIKDPRVAIAGLLARHRDAVITGTTAGHLYGWPNCDPFPIRAALPQRARSSEPYLLTERRINPDWVGSVGGVRITTPALTALDVLPDLGGDLIDTLLRTRQLQLRDLQSALAAHPHRRGNAERLWLLEDSKDQPWSAAERLAHRHLRSAGITGWVTNHRVTARGNTYFLDIAFPELGLALEVDGWEFHRFQFEADHRRQTNLLTIGWRTMPITWLMLQEEPQFIDCVRAALHQQ